MANNLKNPIVCHATEIWFNVGPQRPAEGLERAALTMRPDSPYYKKEDWISPHGKTHCLTGFETDGVLLNLEEMLAKETGLKIFKYQCYYTLQVCLTLEPENTLEQIAEIEKKLIAFVEKHFMPYQGEAQSATA